VRFLEFENDPVLDLYEKLHSKLGKIAPEDYEQVGHSIASLLSDNVEAVEYIQYEILSKIMRLRKSGVSPEVQDALERVIFLPQEMLGKIEDYLKQLAEGRDSVPGQA